MIQDIEPHEYRNEYQPLPPDEDSIFLAYSGRTILAAMEGRQIRFPTFGEMEAYMDRQKLYEDYTYLFAIDGMRFYLGNPLGISEEEQEIDFRTIKGYEMLDTQTLREGGPKYLNFAGVTGWQLHRWYTSRRYCGRCASPMVKDAKERMMFCPECHLMDYPKISPAVIIAVTDGNRILMSKYAGREYKKYALLAGFNEIGETIEETVKREVMEEVGLQVKNITYYKSQPWSFSDTLLLGFFCELDGEDKITLDQEELALAQWFEREDIPVKEDDLSLTNEMMIAFKNGRK